mgnify:CR=1 FL=1
MLYKKNGDETLVSTVVYWYTAADQFFLPNNMAQIPQNVDDLKFDQIIFDCNFVDRSVYEERFSGKFTGLDEDEINKTVGKNVQL